jgi:hypothetical protein
MKKYKILLSATAILVSTFFISINISSAEFSCHDINSYRHSCLYGRISAINNVLLYLDKGDELIQYFNKARKFWLTNSIKNNNEIYKHKKECKTLPPKIYEDPFYQKTFTIDPEIYEKFPSIDKPERAKITNLDKLQLMNKEIEGIEYVLQMQQIFNTDTNLTTLAARLSLIEEELIKRPLGIILMDFLEEMDHWGPCMQNAIKRLESAKYLDSKEQIQTSECCICYENALKSISCKKNHSDLICLSCLRQIEEAGNKCPICRESLNIYG